MRAWIVNEADDQGMALERLLDDRPLDADAAPVNQTDFAQPGPVCFGDVFLDDRRDLARTEGVKVQLAFDRDVNFVALRNL